MRGPHELEISHLPGAVNIPLGTLAIPFVLMALPFITGLIIGTDTSSLAGFSVTLVGSLLYLPVLLIASGILRTFITGSWTLTYRSLIAAKAE